MNNINECVYKLFKKKTKKEGHIEECSLSQGRWPLLRITALACPTGHEPAGAMTIFPSLP